MAAAKIKSAGHGGKNGHQASRMDPLPDLITMAVRRWKMEKVDE